MRKPVDDYLHQRLRDLPARAVHGLITGVAEIDAFNGWWQGRGLGDPLGWSHLKPVVAPAAAASARTAGGNGGAVQTGSVSGRPLHTVRSTASIEAGYAEVLRAIYARHGEIPLQPEVIMACHARMLQYSHAERDRRGRFRTLADLGAVQGGRESPALRPADPDRVPELLAIASDWTNAQLAATEYHPLLVIAGFVLEFLAIRPFADGNGRLSRLLTALLLLRCGYSYVSFASLDVLIAERWPEYYFGLRHSQATVRLPHPDISSWLQAFLEVLQLQVRQLRQRCAGQPDPSRLSTNQLRIMELFGGEEEITNRLVCQELALPKDTTKQVLNRLLQLNLLRRLGSGRAVRYRRILSSPSS